MRDFGNTAIAERFLVLCGRVGIVRRFKMRVGAFTRKRDVV